MPVASDHVGGQEYTILFQAVADRIEQAFQLHHVVQRLIGNHDVVATGWLPCVEVAPERDKLVSETRGRPGEATPFQHRGVDIQTFQGEVVDSPALERLSEAQLTVAIARAYADKSSGPFMGTARPFHPIHEKRVEVRDRVLLEDGLEIAIRPIVINLRKIVHVRASLVISLLRLDAPRVFPGLGGHNDILSADRHAPQQRRRAALEPGVSHLNERIPGAGNDLTVHRESPLNLQERLSGSR